MALSAKVSNLTCPASLGDQDSTSLGFDPIAAMFFMTNATATGGSAIAQLGFGFSGSSAEDYVTYFNSRNGLTASDVIRSTLSTSLIKTTVGGSTTGAVTATMSSLGTDKFTVNYTTVTSGVYTPYIAFGGSDITHAVAGSKASNTTTANFSVTGLSFQPDVVFFSAILLTTTGTANNNNSISFGVATSSSNRWCSVLSSQHNVNPSSCRRGFYNDRCAVIASVVADSTVDEYDFVSMNSDGFTLSHPTASGTAYLINYLALKGGSWSVGDSTLNTTTGNQSVTGMSFQPTGTIFCSSGYSTASTITPSSRMSLGLATSSSDRQAYWMGEQDNANPTVADKYYAQDKCLLIYEEAGGGSPTSKVVADYVSNNSDGFTFNISATDGVAYNFGWVSFGSTPTATNHNALLLMGAG